MKVLVIGAQNIDIFAQSSIEYVLKDSNPSKIHLSFGGVGRNMAENLKRLGNDVHFLTVFADDFFAKAAKQSLIDMNINILESIDEPYRKNDDEIFLSPDAFVEILGYLDGNKYPKVLLLRKCVNKVKDRLLEYTINSNLKISLD